MAVKTALVLDSNNQPQKLQSGDILSVSADVSISASDIDWSTGIAFYKTLSGNATFTFSNATNGQTIVVAITQSSGGSNTAAFPAGVLWANAITPVLTTTANKTDVFTFVKINGVLYGSYVQNF